MIQAWRVQILMTVWLAVLLTADLASAETARIEQGSVDFAPGEVDARVPRQFQLGAHRFDYQLKHLPLDLNDMDLAILRFPSPVTTPHDCNNTVHCEYYLPRRPQPVPAVVVLHILGGDFELSRTFCHALVQRGVAALFLKMPYYGPRRPPQQQGLRMISRDPRATVANLRQAVLDIRRAVAWLGSRPEIDAQQLGVFGISLGGITAALAATAEPRLHNVCLLLAGGDIVRLVQQSPEVADVRQAWLAGGQPIEELVALVKTIDPVTYGHLARDRRILMLNAARDEVMPKACTEALWKALGRPEIEWLDGGHYSVGRHLLYGLRRVAEFFGPRQAAAAGR